MPKIYNTVQGDMWDGIAKKVYGSESGINTLLEANPEYNNVVIFSAGVTLVVPDYKVQDKEILPPWRR